MSMETCISRFFNKFGAVHVREGKWEQKLFRQNKKLDDILVLANLIENQSGRHNKQLHGQTRKQKKKKKRKK